MDNKEGLRIHLSLCPRSHLFLSLPVRALSSKFHLEYGIRKQIGNQLGNWKKKADIMRITGWHSPSPFLFPIGIPAPGVASELRWEVFWRVIVCYVVCLFQWFVWYIVSIIYKYISIYYICRIWPSCMDLQILVCVFISLYVIVFCLYVCGKSLFVFKILIYLCNFQVCVCLVLSKAKRLYQNAQMKPSKSLRRY